MLSLVCVCQGQEAKERIQSVDPNAMPIIKYLWYGFDLLDIRRGIEGRIDVELSATVQSKHIWHGLDLMDDHGVFFPVAGVSLGDTGFAAKIIGAYALSSGFERSDELNYAGFYSGGFLEDTRYATDFTANYFYYGKPKVSRRMADAQEVGASFSWPKLLGDASLVPSYYVGCIWACRAHSGLSGITGFIHVFGLAYDLKVDDFWPGGQEQSFRFSGDITYNDGFGGVDQDWSHAVLGLSTSLGSGNLGITPYINYQISMEDTVNSEDELWSGVNFTYRF